MFIAERNQTRNMDPLYNHRKHRQYPGFSTNGKGIRIPIYRFRRHLLFCMVLCLLLPGFNQAQSYCWPNVQIACFYGDMITRVNFSNISHAENVCNNDPDGKKDFTTTVPAATVIPGNTYTLTITLNVNSSAGARAWIDFNRNNTFEASESFSLGTRTSNGDLSVPITIPAGSSAGMSRLRITNRKNNVSALPGAGDACHSLSSYRGQIKDYAIYISSETPLPVELSHFDATIQGDAVMLVWTTASEKNNHCFNLERSEDGISWINLQAMKGRGNSSTRSEYDFSDHAPIHGYNYYRLKQSDDNNNYSYSNMIVVDFGPVTIDDIYPNPFQDAIIIKANSRQLPVMLYNNQGELVPTAISYSTDHQMILDTRPLEKGLYVLVFNQHAYKFIKN